MSRRSRGGSSLLSGTDRNVSISSNDELQLRRAEELKLIGRWTAADRIARCGQQFFFKNKYCHRRECPQCSVMSAIRNRHANLMAMRVIEPWQLYLLTIGAHRLGALNVALERVRAGRLALGIWCRRAGIGAVGRVHLKLTGDERLWAVHLHVALGPVAVDLQDLQRVWQSAVGKRARVMLSGPASNHTAGWVLVTNAPEPAGGRTGQAVRARQASLRSEQVASYLARRKHECPEPGTMSLAALDELWTAIRGKKLGLRLGTGRTRALGRG
jgi:hypothetical protein